MEKHYTHVSLEERCTIARLHEDGQSCRQIAAALDRPTSTVSRELKRNAGTQAHYRPVQAQERARARRRTGSRMERDAPLRELVLDRLAAGWSPEQVSSRLKLEQDKASISHESIYRFIDSQIRRTKDYRWRLYLPQAKSKRGWRGRKGGSSATHIKDRVSIDQRPLSAADRAIPGHWETDLMLFSNKRDNVLVTQERTSRLIYLDKQTDKKAARVAKSLKRHFADLPPGLRLSLTQDNGTEFAQHHVLNKMLAMPTYFCHPCSPWQKGGVENANSRLRRYLPLKTQPKSFSQRDLKALENRLNQTPRKCLGFKTPAEVFATQLLHFKCESTFRLARE
jgi:IS30 family transposase